MKNKIKLGLYGSSGKMGKSVEQLLKTSNFAKQFIPYLAVGKESSDLFAISVQKINQIEAEVLADVDVWIDFSSPEGLRQVLSATANLRTPIVSGATGLSAKDFSVLKKQAQKRPVFWSSNMSLGLWTFRQALKSLKHIADFDFAIEEIHHTQKKDKPSGTAKTLHEDLEKIVNKKIATPLSHRLGAVFGVHNVLAASANEVLTLQHQALNRTVFAEGALKAAGWLSSQKKGLYSMDDLFKKNKKETK